MNGLTRVVWTRQAICHDKGMSWVLMSADWRSVLVRTRALTYKLQQLPLLSRFVKHDCKQVWNEMKVLIHDLV